jgi:tetratricopeptide (TPR) repeat protein
MLIAPSVAVLPKMAEEILPFARKNLAECWELSKGGYRNMHTAKLVVSSHLTALTSLVEQSSRHREQAASLAAQCYQLHAVLSWHVENLVIAGQSANQAISYSELTESADLHCSSLAMAARVSYYSGLSQEALEYFRRAKPYLSRTSHAVRCFFYRTQASCEAQIAGKEGKARKNLDLAYKHYQLHSESIDHPAIYVASEGFEMCLWKGITRYHLGDSEAAIDILESANPFNAELPERDRVQFINNLIFAELQGPASKRDLERLASRWSEANRRAKDLQSKLRQDEVRAAYDGLLIAYPGEQRIRELRTIQK